MLTSLDKFIRKASKSKTRLRRFLTRLTKDPPRKLDLLIAQSEKEVWTEVDCLSCANCCRSMTPTYNLADMKRIAAHLGMSLRAFQDKWLYQEKGTGDWLNRSTPCQFLDLADNKCSIYDVRPADCAGFPHLPKKKMVDYMHVHKQNVEFCPATHNLVEKLMAKILQDRKQH